jgi:lambda family phage portal protein
MASFLDRALASIAPGLAARRLRDRMAFDQLAAVEAPQKRAWAAAGRGRSMSGWRTPASSANAETEGQNGIIRDRARALERDNAVARSLIEQFAGRVVGTGIVARAVHPDEGMRAVAMDHWNRFCDTCDPERMHDFYGIQHMVARAMFRDGEVLALWSATGNRPDSALRLLEPDHFDETVRRPNIGDVVQGVQYDEARRRQGYWLYDVHPGDRGRTFRGNPSNLVPAQDVDHVFQVIRSGQARGVSWLAPAVEKLRAIEQLETAIFWRKRVEACIAILIQTPDAQGALPTLGTQGTIPKEGGGTLLTEEMRPGMIARTGPGETVQPFIPSVSGDTDAFIRAQLYPICTALGTPYHAVTGDVSQANYSSLRAATLSGYTLLDMVQWLIMVPRFCRPAWARQMAALAAETGNPDFTRVRAEWSMPVRPWVDPLKDITAKIMEIRAGLSSMPDVLAERGHDWIGHLDELAAFAAAVDARALILDTDPRRVNRTGNGQDILDPGLSDPKE